MIRRFIQAAALLAITAAIQAEVIDRIAIIVDRLVVTDSELRRQILLAAFLQNQPAEFSAKTKKEMGERLIEQALIRNEMKLTRYPFPDGPEADPAIEAIRKQYGVDQYQAALKRHNLDETDLRRYLLWRMALLRFTNSRFRIGLQVPPAEIESYYQSNIQGKQNLTLEQARTQIEEALIGEQVNKALYAWLAETRAQTRVETREESFK